MTRTGTMMRGALAMASALLMGCEASHVAAPATPPAAMLPGVTQTLDQRLYGVGVQYLASYNGEGNHKAMSCGEGNGRIGCNWSYQRDTPAQAMYDAQANCEREYGDCRTFAVNGALADWAADIADQYDPAGAAQRQARMDNDRRNAGSFGNTIDGAIGVLSGVQSGLGAARAAIPASGTPTGYSQRGAFADCAAIQGGGGGDRCADRANRMGSIGPGAVTSTYRQGSGAPAANRQSTITGIGR